MDLLIIIIVVLLLVGLLPHWPYSSGWGYGYWPSGLVTIVLVILIVLLLQGHRF